MRNKNRLARSLRASAVSEPAYFASVSARRQHRATVNAYLNVIDRRMQSC